MSNETVGLDCKAYHNTGTHAIPVWAELERVRDVSIGLSKSMADVSRRESKWKMEIGALIEASIEIQYVHRKGADTDFDVLLDSFVNGTAVELAIMDQAIATTGAQGLRAFIEVSDMPTGQPLEDGMIIDITAKPTSHEEAAALVKPDWYEVP